MRIEYPNAKCIIIHSRPIMMLRSTLDALYGSVAWEDPHCLENKLKGASP